MPSSGDEYWKIVEKCGRWAVESQDRATRHAFRQMATALAQLAFGGHLILPNDDEATSRSVVNRQLDGPRFP